MTRAAILLSLVCLIACGRAAPTIDLSLVVSPPSTGPDFLGLFSPKFTECSACTVVELVAPSGARSSVTAETTPRLHLEGSDVESLEVAELRNPGVPHESAWIVIAVPSSAAGSRLDALAREFEFDQVLVSLNGRPAHLDSPLVWGSGITIAQLPSAELAMEFARGLGLPVKQLRFDEAAFAEEKEQLNRPLER